MLTTANGTAAAGSDYTAVTQTVTFAPGETSKTVGVRILGDRTNEPNETFTVTLSNAAGATIGTGTATVTIVNDDGKKLEATGAAAVTDDAAALTREELDSGSTGSSASTTSTGTSISTTSSSNSPASPPSAGGSAPPGATPWLVSMPGGAATLTFGATGTITFAGATRALAETSAIEVLGTAGADALTIVVESGATTVPVTFSAGGGSDSLASPAQDQRWSITGFNAGHVGNVSFTDVEHLVGAPDNRDTFVIEPGGSFAGLLTGGDRGFDTLDVRAASASATYVVTGPDSGLVTLDGVQLRYAGLEPVSVGPAPNLTITYGDFTDQLVLEPCPSTIGCPDGSLVLRSTNGSGEDHVFAPPIGSLTIGLGGGDDSLVIQSIDLLDVPLSIDGGLGANDILTFAVGQALQDDLTVMRVDDIVVPGGVGITSDGTIALGAQRSISVGTGATIHADGDLTLGVLAENDQAWDLDTTDFKETEVTAALTVGSNAVLIGDNVHLTAEARVRRFADFVIDVLSLQQGNAPTFEGSLTFADNGATGDTITRGSGSWIDDGFLAGQTVDVTTSPGVNNGSYLVDTVSATVLTLGSGAVANGTHDGTVTARQRVFQGTVDLTDSGG
ncbi:MAG: Calx-beta domain-containing protein, partial [Nocardioidaceae bacterium]